MTICLSVVFALSIQECIELVQSRRRPSSRSFEDDGPGYALFPRGVFLSDFLICLTGLETDALLAGLGVVLRAAAARGFLAGAFVALVRAAAALVFPFVDDLVAMPDLSWIAFGIGRFYIFVF